MKKYRKLYLIFIFTLLIGGIYFFSSRKQENLDRVVVSEPTQTPVPITPTLTPTKDARNGKWWINPTSSHSTPTVKTQNELASLLADNAGCSLPCFLGVMPGETTLEEVEDRLLKFHIKDAFYHADGYDSYRLSTFVSEEEVTSLLAIDFHINSNVVSWIEVTIDANAGTELMSYYSLKEIAQEHGSPDGIYISMEERFEGAYSLYVIYESKMAIYLSGWAKEDESGYSVCPNYMDIEGHLVTMAFASPASDRFDMRTLIYDIYYAPSLEEFANISTDDFYQLLLTEENPCFTVTFDEE